jgi:hypothetical protein
MGHLFSSGTRSGAGRNRRWIKAAAAGLLALCGTLAHAGVLSVSTSQASGLVTFVVSDSAPADMCADGLCYADFAIDFDPAQLEFLVDATASPYFALANAESGGPFGAQVMVSFLADPDTFPVSNELFTLGFRALVTEQVALRVGPRDFGFPVDGAYLPPAIEVSFNAVANVVPEPHGALLLLTGLAGLAARRRQRTARIEFPINP